MTGTQPKPGAAEVVAKLDTMGAQVATILEAQTAQREEFEEFKQKSAVAQYPAGFNGAPYGIIGGIPSDSEGYSFLKAAAFSKGRLGKEKAKYEIDVGLKLKALYMAGGWMPEYGENSFVVPYATRNIPRDNSANERMVVELVQKMVVGNADPDEMAWMQRRMGRMVTKDLGTLSETSGGVLLGFPTLGELIDMQRNVEVFAQCGATEMALPPNGRLQFPKLTNSTTAYWVGEAVQLTESTPTTGYLDLQAKKLGIRVDINNELIRFGTTSAEALIRGDMAKVGGLKADLAMLEGTGGTQIKGLITYDSASSWTSGSDKLLTYTVTSNLLQVSDAASMEALLPDTAGEPTAWVMRRDLWAKLRNRRADAAVTTDAAGQYLANITRSVADKLPLEWDGTKVVRSSQVSNTRSTNKTYVILGNFKDWITARFGIMEFLMTNTSDQAFQYDQTQLRAIQHIDAGPRHCSSFCFADAVSIA